MGDPDHEKHCTQTYPVLLLAMIKILFLSSLFRVLVC
jgi:hypothetical protein